MSLIIALILIVIIFVLGHYYVQRKFSFWRRKGIPFVKPTFPFGNIGEMRKKRNLAQILQPFYHELKRKGSFGGFFIFTQPVMLPTDLDFIKTILVKDFQSFHDRGLYSNPKVDPLTGHLIALPGSQWRNMRRRMSPAFSSGKMKMLYQNLLQVADQLKEYLISLSEEKSEVEFREVLAQFTTDVIGNIAFGIDINSLSNPNNEFRQIGRKIIDNGNFLKIFFAALNPGLAKKIKLQISNSSVLKFIMNLVRDTVEYREKNNVHRNDFMSLLIQIRNNENVGGGKDDLGSLTIEEFAAQVYIFFIAGFETSSSTMTFAIYEMAINQDIQDRVRQEIIDVLERNNGVLTFEAVLDLNYLEQVICETLRKYPVVTDLYRKTTKDYKVPNSNHVIEKGVQVLIPLFSIHRDPEIYPDPDKFDPERFTPENIQARHPCAWLPFGEGPRNCIGMRFGLMQTKVGLATILSNFKVTPTKKTPIPVVFKPSNPFLTPIDGMHLRIERIK